MEAFIKQMLGDKTEFNKAEVELALMRTYLAAYNKGKADEVNRAEQARLSYLYDY